MRQLLYILPKLRLYIDVCDRQNQARKPVQVHSYSSTGTLVLQCRYTRTPVQVHSYSSAGTLVLHLPLSQAHLYCRILLRRCCHGLFGRPLLHRGLVPGVLQLVFRTLKSLNVFEKFDRLLVLVFRKLSYIRVSAQYKYRSRTV